MARVRSRVRLDPPGSSRGAARGCPAAPLAPVESSHVADGADTPLGALPAETPRCSAPRKVASNGCRFVGQIARGYNVIAGLRVPGSVRPWHHDEHLSLAGPTHLKGRDNVATPLRRPPRSDVRPAGAGASSVRLSVSSIVVPSLHQIERHSGSSCSANTAMSTAWECEKPSNVSRASS